MKLYEVDDDTLLCMWTDLYIHIILICSIWREWRVPGEAQKHTVSLCSLHPLQLWGRLIQYLDSLQRDHSWSLWEGTDWTSLDIWKWPPPEIEDITMECELRDEIAMLIYAYFNMMCITERTYGGGISGIGDADILRTKASEPKISRDSIILWIWTLWTDWHWHLLFNSP